MKKLPRLPKLNHKDSISKLTSFYNTVESSFCYLMLIGLDSTQYERNIIIFDGMPDLAKLMVTRKLYFLNITGFMDCNRSELEARDNCYFGIEKKSILMMKISLQHIHLQACKVN